MAQRPLTDADANDALRMLSDYFSSLAPPAPQHVITRLDTIDGRLDAIERRLTASDLRSEQSRQWTAAKAENHFAIHGNDHLTPLHVIVRDAGGNEVLQAPATKFPATRDDLLRLRLTAVNNLLTVYNLNIRGTLEEKKRTRCVHWPSLVYLKFVMKHVNS